MKNYIITNKKGEKTRVIADSLDDAIQIYNKKYTKDSEIYRGVKIEKVDGNWEINNQGVIWEYSGSMSLAQVKKILDKGLDKNIWDSTIEDACVKDSSIDLDWAGPIRDIEYLAKKYSCTYKRVGTENGYPVIKFTGTRQNLQKLCKQYGMDKEDFEEFVEN